MEGEERLQVKHKQGKQAQCQLRSHNHESQSMVQHPMTNSNKQNYFYYVVTVELERYDTVINISCLLKTTSSLLHTAFGNSHKISHKNQ